MEANPTTDQPNSFGGGRATSPASPKSCSRRLPCTFDHDRFRGGGRPV